MYILFIYFTVRRVKRNHNVSAQKLVYSAKTNKWKEEDFRDKVMMPRGEVGEIKICLRVNGNKYIIVWDHCSYG